MLLGTYERAGRALVARARRPGTSHSPCCRMTSSASRRAWKSASSTSRRSVTSASARWSTGRSRSRPTAIRWSGPVRGLKNFWVACGVMAGFSQGGGVGLALSQWMVSGDPGADVWAMDVARYGGWATLAYTNAKVRENYSRRFRIRFPNEELPAARPLRTTRIYEHLARAHAVFGDYCGLEHALWFAPGAEEAHEDITFHRSNAHAHVGDGVPRGARGRGPARDLQLRQVRGDRSRAAEDWLSRVMANHVPAVGRIALTPMLNERGKLIGDFTMCRPSAERVFLDRAPMRPRTTTGAGSSAIRRPPASPCAPCAMEYVGLSVAGPRSRELLQTLVQRGSRRAPRFRSSASVRWMSAWCPRSWARISFTGELGYEIWVRARVPARALRAADGRGAATSA